MDADYDIPATLTWLTSLPSPATPPLRVALQWPDALLGDALGVAADLKAGARESGLEAEFFIVADSSFNPAALDEVTAIDHGKADVAIHYGPASLAAPTRLPCRFVFGKKAPADPPALAAALLAHAATLPPSTPACVLLLDQRLEWVADEVVERLAEGTPTTGSVPPVVVGRARATTLDPANPLPPAPENTTSLAGLTWTLPPGAPPSTCAYVWAGPDDDEENGGQEGGFNPALEALRLALSGAAWASLSTSALPPYTLTPGLPATAAAASRRRYFLIHKARAATLVGILVTALGDPAVVAEAESLRSAARAAGKAPYTFIVGRPTPSKLANFPEIDVWVAVADSGPGQLVGGRDWLAPVVTPHEARLAWAQPTGSEGGEEEGEADPLDAWDPTTYRFDEPGEMRTMASPTSAPSSSASHFSSLSLVPRGGRAVAGGSGGGGAGGGDHRLAPVRSGADFLSTRRTWQGLEAPSTGAPAVEAVGVVAGRVGRAAGYEGEG